MDNKLNQNEKLKSKPLLCEDYMGRKVRKKIDFEDKETTFGGLYCANGFLRKTGYVYGSLCGKMPVAIVKGETFNEYHLPEKWKNFTEKQKNSVIGVVTSSDFRDGIVTVRFFE